MIAMLLEIRAEADVLPSRSFSLSGIKNQAMMPPTAANAAPIRKTPRAPLSGSSNESWMGVKTCVPMAAPALPTAAANPRKWPRRGVGNDSALQRKVATCKKSTACVSQRR